MTEFKSLNHLNFLQGGGETVGLIRLVDWSKTPINNPDAWPQSLKSALSICINSNFPIAIYWGTELVLLYNDAWTPIPGNKHPWAFGKPAIEVWPEIWKDIQPQFTKAFSGTPGGSKDALLPMQRHGYTEECYFDFTFTPIYGESGKVEGIFNAVIETTYRAINERRAQLLQRLSDAINSVTNGNEVFQKAIQILNAAKQDVPFYYIYEFDKAQQRILQATSEQEENIRNEWPLKDALAGITKHIEHVSHFFYNVPDGFWPEPPNEALLLPLKSNDGGIFGCIVGGLSSRRKYDKDYKSFYESIATIIGGELNTIRSFNQERERAESLAQIDKAKTAFFSNISHEFRTPLTLMLSPLAAVIDAGENLTEEQKKNLSTSYRNTLRLQKLVNTLLDFSRIEAGRMEGKFEKVNIAELTEDLASSFRSAIENAGIEYKVTLNTTHETIYVDVDMWEKIILNLLSNAFKYTESGVIEITLKSTNDNKVILTVTDTGVGIKQEDQAKIFERFYRANTSGGRSQEGTGIGLAMVKELVHLHQGEISVKSEYGKGSTFSISLPANLSNSDTTSKLPKQKSAIREAFIEEASKWNKNDVKTASPANNQPHKTHLKAKVLVADDNSDMRDYINRLLQNEFEVRSTSNGEDAFEIAVSWLPELIVSDIMMPKLDGFGLLKKLKSNSATRNIPIVFLSARAGEEAKIEGITAGADDYLVKPFSAKELIARVTNHITISRTRTHAEKEFFNLFLQSPAQIHVTRGPEHIVEFFHPLGKPFVGGRDITGMKIREAVPEIEGQGYFETLDQVYNEGKSFFVPEARVTLPDKNGQQKEYYFNKTYHPWKDLTGKIQGVLQFTFDVTEQAKASLKIKESEERFRLLATSIPQIIWITDARGNIEYLSDQWEKYTGQKPSEGMKQFASLIHLEDIDNVRAKWHNAIAEEKPWEAEYRLKDLRTSTYNWFSGYTLPLKDNKGNVVKWIGSSSDISAQKHLNETLSALVDERTSELNTANEILQLKNNELSRTQNFLGTVLDSSVEMVNAFDTELNYTFINKRAQEFSEDGAQDKIGKNITNIYPGFEKTDTYQYLLRALQGETIHIDSRRAFSNNDIVFETFILPLRHNDSITGVLTLQRDITVLTHLAESLKKSNAELQRSNGDLQQFAHVASHDLKEPVRKIKLYGNMLKTNYENILPEKGQLYLGKIEHATERISSMIDGVLKYSSVDALQQAFEEPDLNDIIRNITEDLEVVIKEKDAEIKAEHLPTLTGSTTLIYQLFYNLINNSLKFTKKEVRPVIQIRSEIVQAKDISGKPDASFPEQYYIKIAVIDNGIGFDQAYTDKIFESFSRLNPKDKFEGTGLGLALCKKIVERHNGFIKAFGKPGEGATFSVYLPVTY